MFGPKLWSFASLVVYLGTSSVYADPPHMRGPKHPNTPLMECMKELSVPEEAVMDVKKTGNVDGVDPCLFSCVFKKMGIINSKGMYDVDKAMELHRNEIKNPEMLDKMDNIKKLCSKVNDEEVTDGEEGCDRAVMLFKCYSGLKHDMMIGKDEE